MNTSLYYLAEHRRAVIELPAAAALVLWTVTFLLSPVVSTFVYALSIISLGAMWTAHSRRWFLVIPVGSIVLIDAFIFLGPSSPREKLWVVGVTGLLLIFMALLDRAEQRDRRRLSLQRSTP